MSVITKSWINCPVCGESDMGCETNEEGYKIINCVNHNCGSNGGDNFNGLAAKKVDYSTTLMELIIDKNFGIGVHPNSFVAGPIFSTSAEAVQFEDDLRKLVRDYHAAKDNDPRLTITLEQRQDDFMAFLNGNRRLWANGKTRREAVANLIETHGKDFGIEITEI